MIKKMISIILFVLVGALVISAFSWVAITGFNKSQRAGMGNLTSIENIPGTPPPLVVSSMGRLTELIEKAEPYLPTEPQAEVETVPRPHNLPG